MLNVLGAARSDAHAEAIRELLADEPEALVRQAAIKALGHIGDPESGAVLLELTQSSNPSERNQAINAIHSIKEAETVAALAKDWSSLSDDAQFAVIGAAARLPRPNEDLVTIARDSVNHPNIRVRSSAIRVLGASKNEKHVELLGSVLRGAKKSQELSAAREALRRIGTERAAEEVLRNLDVFPQSQQESVRIQFERIRDRRARLRTDAESRR